MNSLKDKFSFWNWQGSHLHYVHFMRFVALGIALISIFFIFLLKEKISTRIKNKKIYIFKSSNNFFQMIGILGLIWTAFRIGTWIYFDYPLKWEILNLHLCRFHFMALFFLLAIRKKQYIKYITYLSMIGGIYGLLYLNLDSPYINQIGTDNMSPTDWLKKHPDYGTLTNFERLSYKLNFSHYSEGFDNINFWDSMSLHITIIVMPVYLWVAYQFKLSTKEFHLSQSFYFTLTILIWFGNWTSVKIADNHQWWFNIWYLGVDKANDYKTVFGPLSLWPYNLITYIVLGVSSTSVFHLIMIFQSKFLFFSKSKKFIYRKSLYWEDFKKGYKTLFVKKKKQSK